MAQGFYTLKCGCVKYTNAHTHVVKMKYELSGSWDVKFCPKHSYKTLSVYEQSLKAEYDAMQKGK